MAHFVIQNYHFGLKESVLDLYKAIKEKHQDIVFWWPGPENTWDYVLCVKQDHQLIAKAQIAPITVIPDGSDSNFCHQIYLNMKVHPDWELNTELKDHLFHAIYEKSLEMKEKLSSQYKTKLCFGNYSNEVIENKYLQSKGFIYEKSIVQMKRDLIEPIEEVKKPTEKIDVKEWKIEKEEEEKKYLEADLEIWPHAPIGINRLRELKQSPLWTAITAFYKEEIVGSVIAWQDEPNVGITEEVSVREKWRNQGIARYLLSLALNYLKKHDIEEAYLEVEVQNHSALHLYHSVGFEAVKEEQRYWMDLD
ncbi:GNAT family N-acetyltransferase [Heyndrickxia sp. NPDC080065]|uniref:GNAT family N-acetyltransferase n=1 Tax=Heyndrickxia sp. NPDC080065 TaxID=3390568 RepID=UPI003D08DA92